MQLIKATRPSPRHALMHTGAILTMSLMGPWGCGVAIHSQSKQEQEFNLEASGGVVESLANGTYAIHSASNPQKCLDISGANSANGTVVQIWDCNGSAAQSWTYNGSSLKALGNKCLDVVNGSTANGTHLQIWDCVPNSTNQKFRKSGNSIVWASHNNLCLDMTNGSFDNGTPLQIWSCVGGNTNQAWTFGGTTGAAAPAPVNNNPQAPGGTTPVQPVSGSVLAYTSKDDLSLALRSSTVALGTRSGNSPIWIDTTQAYQQMLGFGASITDSSSYLLANKLSASDRQSVLTQLFDAQKGIGLSVLRQQMGASDFSSVGNYSYDDNPPGGSDAGLGHFNLTQDLKATIPVLKQALAINPGIFVMVTPWSPPAWMKTNGSMTANNTGGNGHPWLDGGSYDAFAQYFVKTIQGYAQQGIAISALTPQNEPLYEGGGYPGMGLNAQSEQGFIANNLGPALARAGLKTQIWGYDHNWDQPGYPDTLLGDASSAQYVEGTAWHCYGGDVSAMGSLHDKYPNKSTYMTECSGGTWQSDPFGNTMSLLIGSANNWARSVTLWNMALDQSGGPTNNGCATCRGVVTINNGNGQVTFNADYYALGHFSKFIARGATRIGSGTSDGSLSSAAFKNPDGSLVLVVYNSGGNDKNIQAQQGPNVFSATVPAGGASTFVWKG